MTYAVLWALVVFVCYVDGRGCETKDVYFYDSEEECLQDLEYIHNLEINSKEELSAELTCEMR